MMTIVTNDSKLFQKLLVGLIVASLTLSILTAFLISGLKGEQKTQSEKQKFIGTWVTVPEDDAAPIELAFTPDNWLTIMGEQTANYTIDSNQQTLQIQYLPGLGNDTVMHYRFEDEMLILTQEPDKVMRCKKVVQEE